MGLPLTADAWAAGSVRTERLLLRAPEARDREDFLDLGSDPVVNHHLGGGQDRASLDDTLPEVPADRPAQYVMERGRRFLGWVGLSRREADRPGVVPAGGRDGVGVLELSYVLPVHAWGQGYAAEACTALLELCDERLGEPVVLCTQVGNTRSRALAARLGFAELERFEEFGAEQWFGVRPPSPPNAATLEG
ncbi:GNAT family N-acetyltransferase [Nocardioides sp. STR2]|uniref:GNAT family N-acetyltransferase n=1 Tax=Nocardioides pini TaxID=2975053 RepID=A0ABT4CBY7_9ACTN|nr:GNAT family N-acetyltransferase [Nocardioides pini]MCY4725489.1 GNAT family N-acetyltransferase [Nocardioides pini]